jgi:hypothetical protein
MADRGSAWTFILPEEDGTFYGRRIPSLPSNMGDNSAAPSTRIVGIASSCLVVEVRHLHYSLSLLSPHAEWTEIAGLDSSLVHLPLVCWCQYGQQRLILDSQGQCWQVDRASWSPYTIFPALSSSLGGKTVTITDITCGYEHAFFLSSSGQVWSAQAQLMPLPAPCLHMASGSYHSLFLCAPGTVLAWGWNKWGQCGIGDAVCCGEEWLKVPVPIPHLEGMVVTHIAASALLSAAIVEGCLAVWGVASITAMMMSKDSKSKSNSNDSSNSNSASASGGGHDTSPCHVPYFPVDDALSDAVTNLVCSHHHVWIQDGAGSAGGSCCCYCYDVAGRTLRRVPGEGYQVKGGCGGGVVCYQ